MRLLILSNLIIIILLSCQRDIKNKPITIIVKLDTDSSKLELFPISIFEKGFPVKDTFANFDGSFTLYNKNEIEGIILGYAGCYPVYKTMKEIEEDSVIYLKSSDILMRTGGMGIDTVLINVGDTLENKRNKWNKQQKKKK